MNITILIGNLSKVPHFIGANGTKKAVAFLTVANNDEKETIFAEVTVFGKTAEYVHKNISTGARVSIEGKLSYRPKKSKGGDTYQEAYISCHRLMKLSHKSES